MTDAAEAPGTGTRPQSPGLRAVATRRLGDQAHVGSSCGASSCALMARAADLAATLGVCWHARSAQAAEWFQWRGPNRDGHLRGDRPAARSGRRPARRAGLARPPAPAPATPRSRRPDGRLYTLGARGDIEYVMAFDRATGKKLWETPNGRRFRNEHGRRTAQHADRRRRSAVRVRRQRRADVPRRRDRQEDLVGERRPEVRRQHTRTGATANRR